MTAPGLCPFCSRPRAEHRPGLCRQDPLWRSARKPHSHNAGYVTERKSQHPKLPGHFVIYDRDQPNVDIDADDRWIVMHEPSSYHVSCSNQRLARDVMESMAAGGNDYDFGQNDESGAA